MELQKKFSPGNRRWVTHAVMAAMLVFYLFLAWSTPYSAIDDLEWGLDVGVHWLRDGSLNSRYVGNFFAVIMCRSQLVKTLILGLSTFFIPVLMASLAPLGERETKFLPAYLACNAGMLLTPSPVWRETFAWVCGFGNYGISILLFLIWLVILRHVEQNRSHLRAWAAGLFLLTLSMSMFLESQTVLQLGGAVLLSLYAFWDKDLRLPFWASLAGSLAGCFLMFFNGIYSDLVNTGGAIGLRELTFSLSDGLAAALYAILRQYLGFLLPQGFTYGRYLDLPMAVIVFCGFWKSPLRPLCVSALWPLYYNWMVLFRPDFFTGRALWLGSALAWGLPFLALLVQRGELPQRISRLLLYLAAALVLLPMAAVNTRGPRLYLFSFLLLVLLAVHTLGNWLNALPLTCLAAAGLLYLMLLWGGRYVVILSCNQLRDKLIAQTVESGADTLVLPADRYQFTVWWMRDPESGPYGSYFRQFYHIPEDVTLIFLRSGSYEHWPDIPPDIWEARIELPPVGDFTPYLP